MRTVNVTKVGVSLSGPQLDLGNGVAGSSEVVLLPLGSTHARACLLFGVRSGRRTPASTNISPLDPNFSLTGIEGTAKALGGIVMLQSASGTGARLTLNMAFGTNDN